MIKQLFRFGFILALVANCWGGVVAASLCQHRNCGTSLASENSSVSNTENINPHEHCSPGGAMHSHEQPRNLSEAETLEGVLFIAHESSTGLCAHCMGTSQAPANSLSKSAQAEERRVAVDVTLEVSRPFMLPRAAVFPAISPSQESPPAPAERRHLLISTFLI